MYKSMNPQIPTSEETLGKPFTIYVCSPYRPVYPNKGMHESEQQSNIERARLACKMIVSLGYMPLAPHLYFTGFLNDSNREDREKGMELALQWLETQADELWVFGGVISDGMAAEIAKAKELGLPVRCMLEPCNIVEQFLRSCLPTLTKNEETH